MNFDFGYNCSCFVKCENLANNLVSTFYDQWLSKVEILEDEKGYLINIFDNLNLHKMVKGITPVLLNFGNGITITNFTEIKYDKNYQPVSASANIALINNKTNIVKGFDNGLGVKAIDWKLFKKENKESLKAELENLGYRNAKIIDIAESHFLMVKTNTPIYKCIFFRNNLTDTPSLRHLNKILHNIHELDIINDRNQKLINAVYFAKTGKKLSPEQANNISITVTDDRYGIVIVESNGEQVDLTDGVNKEVLTQSLNNWPHIKDELDTWEDKFCKYAGIPSEKVSEQRENLGETLSRISRVSVAEKQYYKYIEKFLKEYEAFFETKLVYQFDTLITNTIQSNANQQSINNTAKSNRLSVEKTELEQAEND